MEIPRPKLYRIIAEADGQLVRELISTENRQARYGIDLIAHDEFKAAVSRPNFPYTSTYNKLRKAYTGCLNSGILFRPDSFGGYCLETTRGFAAGEKLTHVIGFLAVLPKSEEDIFEDISAFRRTKKCPSMRLMLGPARFANHSCEPNADYYAASDYDGRNCIVLEALKDIEAGSEITVYYNPNYFGENNMFCRCASHIAGNESKPYHPKTLKRKWFNMSRKRQFEHRLSSKRQRKVISAKHSAMQSDKPPDYRRVSEQSSSSGSSSESSDSETLRTTSSVSDGEQREPEPPTPELIESEEELGGAVHDHMTYDGDETERQRASTPVQDFVPVTEFLQAFYETCPSIDNISRDSDDENEKEFLTLASGVRISEANLRNCLLSIINLHCTSDIQAEHWLDLLRLLIPGSFIPPFNRLKRELQNMRDDLIYFAGNQGDCEFLALKFYDMLIDVVKHNFSAIQRYDTERLANPGKDWGRDISSCFEYDNSGTATITLYLVLNTDGFDIIRHKKMSMWPIWIGLANLPPRLRFAFMNITLAFLFYGGKKPDWDDEIGRVVVDYILAADGQTVTIDGTDYVILLRPIYFVLDLPAKCAILCMMQYNAYYGCQVCTIFGKHAKAHYFPLSEVGELRLPELHERHLSQLESNKNSNPDNNHPVYGVKKKSVFSEIMPFLPLAAPIDYMHQVLLGAAKETLIWVTQAMSRDEMIELSNLAQSTTLVNNYHRQLRGLEHLKRFKANELKVWLLSFGPIALRPYMLPDDYLNFMKLSYAIRLLLISDEYVDLAHRLLEEFLAFNEEERGEKFMSINMHSLRHLGWQVKTFGPLWVTSAFCFESAHHHLATAFSGTKNHLRLVVERYVRRKVLSNCTVDNDILKPLLCKLLGRKPPHLSSTRFNVATERLPEYILNRPEITKFYSKATIGRNDLDSISYTRSQTNSYVYYLNENGNKWCYGQIVVFYDTADDEMCMLNQFRVVDVSGCPLYDIEDSLNLPRSFVKTVKTVENYKRISQKQIRGKLQCVERSGYHYLSIILDHFEHD